MIHPYDLDPEEQAIENALDAGEYVQSEEANKAIAQAVKIAKNQMNKTKNINIRVSERTMQAIKAKALKEGMPYQTYIASVLHKSSVR